MSNTTAVIMIGNSDDNLNQLEWSEFIDDMNGIADLADAVHGRWFSTPDSPYQNAAWCIEIDDERLPGLYQTLASLAHRYGQESIAVVVNQPHLVAAAAEREGIPSAP